MSKSLWETSKGGLTLYAQNWRRLILPLIGLCLPFLAMAVSGAVALSYKNYLAKFSFASALAALIIFVVSLLAAFWSAVALLRAIVSAGANQTLGLKKLIFRPSGLSWLIVWQALVVGLVSFGGNWLLIIFVLIFAVFGNFIFYPVILENANGWQALRASLTLILRHALFWRLLALAIIGGGIIFALSYLLLSAAKFLPWPQTASWLIKIIPVLIRAAFVPFLVGSTLTLFQNARQNPVNQPAEPPKL